MTEQRPAVAPADVQLMQNYIEHELSQTEGAPAQRRERLLRKMAEARATLLAAYDRITPENRDKPTNNEGWTVYDIAAHIAGAEGGMLQLIARARTGQSQVAPDFDIQFYNKRGIEKRREKSFDELRTELAASREKALALIADLSDDEFLKPAGHPTVGDTNIYGVFVAIYRHERQHAADINAALDSAGANET